MLKPGRARPGIVALLQGDRAGGAAMAAATVAALIWANWPGTVAYRTFWLSVAPWSGPLGLNLSYRSWVNEGLMLAFFTIVGLEIRREVLAGELRSPRRALLPVVAALAGMAIPALIYSAIELGGPGARAWGIPTATDIAFALGALALVSRTGTARGRVFLMTLAIADDIFSILVLAILYSHGVHPLALELGLGCVAAMVLVRLCGGPAWPVALLGGLAWWAVLHSGVEAALVGAAIGLLAPRWRSRPPARRPDPSHPGAGRTGPTAARPHAGPRVWELRLQPIVNGGVLPLFAFANAGVRIAGSGIGSAPALRIMGAVIAARLIGKPLAIVTVVWLGRRVGVTSGPGPRTALDLGVLAAVGFTVPLLVIRAALPDGPLAAGATAGLLLATIGGLVLGAASVPGSRRRMDRPGRVA